MEQNTHPAEETEIRTSAQTTEETTAENPEMTAAEIEAACVAEGDEPSQLQCQLDALNEQHLRMAAEYDNFRKRSQREREGIHGEAVAYAVKALLPTYDNLERALAAETTDTEYKKGVKLTMTQLLESLKSIGVERIEAAPGTAFDPNLHNAVMHVESDELSENSIAEAFQQGFRIGDKVIRHAMVQVAN